MAPGWHAINLATKLAVMNPVELALFHQRLDAVCDAMSLVLQCVALSPNIKGTSDLFWTK